MASSQCLNRIGSAFAGADSDAFFEWENEDFAIADLARFSGAAAFEDGVYRGFDEVVVDGDLELNFTKQVGFEFWAAEGLDLAALTPEALAIEDGEAEDFDLGERLFDGFEAIGLNDGDDEFHGSYALLVPDALLEI